MWIYWMDEKKRINQRDAILPEKNIDRPKPISWSGVWGQLDRVQRIFCNDRELRTQPSLFTHANWDHRVAQENKWKHETTKGSISTICRQPLLSTHHAPGSVLRASHYLIASSYHQVRQGLSNLLYCNKTSTNQRAKEIQ